MIAVLRNKHVDSCCRTCLNDISSKFYELFNEYQNSMTLAEMLLICTSIMVEKEDRLPKKLCSSCYNCLVSFYDFRIQAENVEAELKLSQVEKMIDEKLNNPEKVSKIEIKVGNTIMDDSYVTDNLENDFHNLDIVKVESQDSFIAHIDNFNSNNILQEKTDNVSNLNSHYGVSEKSIKCKVCDKKFKKLSKLQIHEEKHNRQLYSCNFCSDTFVQKYKLIRHLMKHSQKHEDTSSEINQNNISQSVTCDMCSANFKSVQSLSAHMRVHIQKGRILSCMFCDKVFKKLSHLKRHELTHEINRPFKCDTCPKSFHTESLLNDHMNRHHGVRPHECPLCSKSFCNISSLTTHLKVHTKEKIYLCPTCGKKFDSSSNLGQHMKRHVGLKLFSCDLCPRSFVTKGELNSHTTTHLTEKSHTCDQCGASFTRRCSLKKHKLRHLGIKPHQCETCSRKFSSKDHLKRHYRTHTGEKPYRCEICERAFAQSNDLVKHKRAHLGDKMYRCTQCSESFRLKNELRHHISEHFITSRLQGINMNSSSQDGDVNLVNVEHDILKNPTVTVGNIDDIASSTSIQVQEKCLPINVKSISGAD